MLVSVEKSNGLCDLEKMAVDFSEGKSLGWDMDDDQRRLIVKLGTEAGIRMEDISVSALILGSRPDHELAPILDHLTQKTDEASALIRAARVLIE